MCKRTTAAIAFLSALMLFCAIATADPVGTADDGAAIVMRELVGELQSLREEVVQLRARVRELETQLAAAKASQPIPGSPQRIVKSPGPA